MNLHPNLTIYKNNSKWIMKPNAKPKVITIPKENIGKFCGLGLGKDFLATTPYAWLIRESDKLGFIKIIFRSQLIFIIYYFGCY